MLAADSLPATQSMLQAHPDLNVIFCIADDGCLGAEQAFLQTKPSKERKDQMFIAGWDGAVPVMKKIVSGSVIRATGALDIVGIGAASIDATADAIEGKGNPRVNYPYTLISQSNPGSGQEADREVRKGVTDAAGQGRRQGCGAPFDLHTGGSSRPAWRAYQSGGLLVALILLCAFFTTRSSNFLTHSNFNVILLQVAIVGLVAVPGAMLVLSGYVDLSVGSRGRAGRWLSSARWQRWTTSRSSWP